MLSLFAAVALAGSAAATTPAAEGDPVVCKGAKIPEVGTRMKPAPVCKRKSEWAIDARDTQRELRQINERGNNPGRAEGR